MKIDLTGKTAVVTGATGELGRTIVRSLAECGANIGICYYNKKDFADELEDEVNSKYSVKAVAIQADVTDIDSVMSMKNEIFKKMGITDIIVNNAVIQIDWKNVLEQAPEDYESQFKSCVMHNVYMAKAFVPDMIKQKYGRVIGINTECAMQNFITQSAYVSGKRGMDGVLRVLAKEVGKYNITVNQVAPGWTISEGCRNTDGSERNINQDFPYIERLPLGRRVTDIEIANAVCFLASDLAGSITGVYLPVCSGNVMPAI
ncbi:MAG TPA: SDR family oxidoreductase [Actinobacteria bacterium]|nr:SDR family oxidoreductase [Actinomycetota bacterium]